MKDIVISTCIILCVAIFAVAAQRLLLPATADIAGFAVRHLVSPAAFMVGERTWPPAIWL